MWIYEIEVTDYCNNSDLKKILNKFGKKGWEIFSVVGYQKAYINKCWKLEYTLCMKKYISDDK